jgi:hypothetical protein
MDQNQKRYAMNRVKEVLDAKTKELKSRLTTKAKEPTDKAKLEAIRFNDVELKSKAQLSTPLGQAFDFSSLEIPNEVDEDKYAKSLVELCERAAKVKDLIMLGDSNVAMKELQSFIEETTVADSQSKTR